MSKETKCRGGLKLPRLLAKKITRCQWQPTRVEGLIVRELENCSTDGYINNHTLRERLDSLSQISQEIVALEWERGNVYRRQFEGIEESQQKKKHHEV